MTHADADASAFMTEATRVTGIITEQRIDKAINAADKAAQRGGAGGLIQNASLSPLCAPAMATAGAAVARRALQRLRELIRDLKRNPWKFFWRSSVSFLAQDERLTRKVGAITLVLGAAAIAFVVFVYDQLELRERTRLDIFFTQTGGL